MPDIHSMFICSRSASNKYTGVIEKMVQLYLIWEGCVFLGMLPIHPLRCIKQVPFESTGIGLQYMQKLSVYTNNSQRCAHWNVDWKIAKRKDPLRHVVISQQSWCSFFAWRSNHPCYSRIISIHKLFIGVWYHSYLTLQDSLLTLEACFQAWDESGSRRSRSSYLPFQPPTQLSVLNYR